MGERNLGISDMQTVATLVDNQSIGKLAMQLADSSRGNGQKYQIESFSKSDQRFNRLKCDFYVLEPAVLSDSLIPTIDTLRNSNPESLVLIYTDNCSYESVAGLLRAGVQGYVLKNCPVLGLAQALDSMARGGLPLSPQVARLILQDYLPSSISDSLPILTKREKQVFEFLKEGVSYKGMGSELNISRNTVHTHVKNIYSKLNAVNKQDAFVKARNFAAA